MKVGDMTYSRQYCEMLYSHFQRDAPIPGPNQLLLEHGQEWTERRVMRWRGTPKACYANAQYLARNRKGLRYAEGYACFVIPVEHAWCVDERGRVVDPTWDGEYQPDYFGMTFAPELVRAIRRVTGESHSLLFTWWKWPEVYEEFFRRPAELVANAETQEEKR